MSINLKQFCGIDEFRLYLNKPGNIDDKTIATNGHILIRIPKDDRYDEIEGSFRKSVITFTESFSDRKWISSVKFKMPKPVPCEYCNETGHAEGEECECCGAGNKNLDTEEICPYCLGLGKEYSSTGEDQDEIIGFPLAPRYLALIETLPNIEISPDKEKRILYFRSGEIDGILIGTKDHK